MSLFSDLISNLNLIDLPLAAGSYTWLNGKILVPIGLFSYFWILLRNAFLEYVLTIILSCWIVEALQVVVNISNLKMCLKAEGFIEKVQSWWSSYHFSDTLSFIFSKKLKPLKLDIKRCNNEMFGHVD